MTFDQSIEVVKRCLTDDCEGCPKEAECNDDNGIVFSAAPADAMLMLVKYAKAQKTAHRTGRMLVVPDANICFPMFDGESKEHAENRLLDLADGLGINIIGWNFENKVVDEDDVKEEQDKIEVNEQ